MYTATESVRSSPYLSGITIQSSFKFVFFLEILNILLSNHKIHYFSPGILGEILTSVLPLSFLHCIQAIQIMSLLSILAMLSLILQDHI